MNILFQAHSGLRYLVLLVGVVALAYFVSGLATKRPVDKGVRILGAAFTGLLDLQILLGLAMVAMGRFYPQLIGHIVMMLLAATVTHVLLVVNRKRPTPGYVLPLVAVAVALALLSGGIMAIGRGVLTHTTLAG
jgi:vacuolar-type H+-ATPase subunit I/STV1